MTLRPKFGLLPRYIVPVDMFARIVIRRTLVRLTASMFALRTTRQQLWDAPDRAPNDDYKIAERCGAWREQASVRRYEHLV